MNVPQATEVTHADALSTDVREINPFWLADERLFDLPTPIHEYADLAADLTRNPGEVPGQLRTQNLLGRHAAMIGSLERLFLARFEASYVAADCSNSSLRLSMRATLYQMTHVATRLLRHHIVFSGGS